MSHKERKEYVFYASIALIPGLVLFGVIPLSVMIGTNDLAGPFNNIMFNTLLFLFTGGYLTLSIVSGFLLIARFYATRTKKFKVISILFFLFIPFFLYYFFFLISAPYYIYSLIKIRDRRFIHER